MELGFTFDTAILTLSFKILSGLYLRNCKVWAKTLMWGVDVQNLSVPFDLGPTRMFSSAVFETYFFYHKDRWIPATDYNKYFYLAVLSPLTTILLLLNVRASKISVHELMLPSCY